MRAFWNRPRQILVFAGVLLVAMLVAFWIGKSIGSPSGATSAAKEEKTASVYYCPMHAQIRLPHPGKCSLCGMDLIPLEETTDPGPRALTVSEAAMKLADIETAKVERREVARSVRMVGKVEFDETRVKTISAWVPGRLDRLYVDFTGVPVKAGEHLVDIYSQELFGAQQELLEGLRAVESLKSSGSQRVREATLATVDAVRQKLRLWGLTDRQIEELESQEAPRHHILVTAPSGGIVIEKLASQGDYVKTGTPIYRVADLRRVWVMLDAYESDLDWLRYGQDVEFLTESYPGVTFRGRIDFMDWVVPRRTRTTKIRVNVDNANERLKPGMFVRATVRSGLDAKGHVVMPSLEGKWICPMHPEVIADAPGSCTVCGMPLEAGAELFKSPGITAGTPLVIPRSAPLVTGKRAVVYVRLPDAEKPTFEGREVILGPRAGDHYVVLSGLDDGEEVVVRGNFKIDSALQIMAKPSMMNPTGGGSGAGRHHGHGGGMAAGDSDSGDSSMADAKTSVAESPPEFQASINELWQAYDEITRALVRSDRELTRASFAALGTVLDRIGVEGLDEDGLKAWQPLRRQLQNEVAFASKGDDLTELRLAFHNLSRVLLHVEHGFGHSDGTTLHEMFCPMAFDGEGASWMQRSKEIANPYFGEAMLRCGEIRKSYSSRVAIRLEGVPEEFQKRLGDLFAAYAEIQKSLADDREPGETSRLGRRALEVLGTLEASLLPEDGRTSWRQARSELRDALNRLVGESEIAVQREAFEKLSESLLAVLKKYGHRARSPVIEMFCPMAFDDKGAVWLQDNADLRNPYFGAAMLRCGVTKRTLPPAAKAGGDDRR